MFTSIVILFIVLIIMYYVLLYWQKRLWSSDIDTLYATEQEDCYLQLHLPVLGTQGSGKTVFLATLSHQLVHDRPMLINDVLSADYLTSSEEKYLTFDCATNQVREESTREITKETLQLFAHQQLPGSKDPQDLFLVMTFGVDSDLSHTSVTHFIDLPGSFFENESTHKSTIDPRIHTADALIYLIDCVSILPLLQPHLQFEYQQSLATLAPLFHESELTLEEYAKNYRRTLRGILQQKNQQNFPIWIVVSKLDLITELHPHHNTLENIQARLSDLKMVIQRYFCDALLVKGVQTPYVMSFISAYPQHQVFWQNITQGAKGFFQHVKNQVQGRVHQARKNSRLIQNYQWARRCIMACLLLGIIPLIQGIYFSALPTVSSNQSWDLNSADHYSQIYATFIQPSFLSTFKHVYQKDLLEEIKALNHIYDDLLQQYQQEFLRQLPQKSLHTWRDAYQTSQSTPIHRLQDTHKALKDFYESFHHIYVANYQSQLELQSSKQIIKQVNRWIQQIPTPHDSQTLSQYALHFNHIVEWKDSCEASRKKAKSKSASTPISSKLQTDQSMTVTNQGKRNTTPHQASSVKDTMEYDEKIFLANPIHPSNTAPSSIHASSTYPPNTHLVASNTSLHQNNTPYTLIPSCVLYRYGLQEQKRLFLLAMAHAQINPEKDIQVIEQALTHLIPLFRVYQGIQRGWKQQELSDHVRRNLQEAWLAIWKVFSQHYPKVEKQSDALRQLELLKNFDEQIKELASTLQMTRKQLQVPYIIQQEWQEYLANACMRVRGHKGYNLEKFKALLRWAKPYLDPHKRAQINFEEFQRQWKKEIKVALQSAQAEGLEKLLKDIQDTLYQFDTYQGQNLIKTWQKRVKQLKQLTLRKTYKVTVKSLTCDMGLLTINDIRWNDQLLGMDRFKPYLLMSNQTQKIKLFAGETHDLSWQAWMPITVVFMDKDLQDDDELFTVKVNTSLGFFKPIEWQAKDPCQFQLTLSPQPAILSWLKEEKLMP